MPRRSELLTTLCLPKMMKVDQKRRTLKSQIVLWISFRPPVALYLSLNQPFPMENVKLRGPRSQVLQIERDTICIGLTAPNFQARIQLAEIRDILLLKKISPPLSST